jgi:hypothetical protein
MLTARQVVNTSASVTERQDSLLENDDTLDVDQAHISEPAQAKRTHKDAAGGQAKRGRTADASNNGPSKKKTPADRPGKFIKDTSFMLHAGGVFRHSRERSSRPKPIEHDESSGLDKESWDNAQGEIINIVHEANNAFMTLRVNNTRADESISLQLLPSLPLQLRAVHKGFSQGF